MTEAQIIAKLRRRFSPPAWAFFAQVANATGALKSRTMDGLAMSLYPSRGLHLHAFEVKVSRSDWLAELRQPEKADEIAMQVDFMWVAAAKGIVTDDLPDGWGLLEPNGSSMKIRRKARLVEGGDVARPFLASILRRACDNAPGDEMLKAARAEGVEEGRKLEKERHQLSNTYAQREARKLREAMEAFQKESGCDLRWMPLENARRLGRIHSLLNDLEQRGAMRRRLRDQARLSQQAAEALYAAADALGLEDA